MAVGLTSSIESRYKIDHSIDAAATVKHGEAVFTYALPVLQLRGAIAALERRSGPWDPRSRSFGPGRGSAPATDGLVLVQDVPVRTCAQPCHSADIYVQEAVLKWLKSNFLQKRFPKFLMPRTHDHFSTCKKLSFSASRKNKGPDSRRWA